MLRLRDNNAVIYEVYYNDKPYNWSRIAYRIGNYRISGDTVYVAYKRLPEGNPGCTYVFPITLVSWSTPRAPDYLLLHKRNRLRDPVTHRLFNLLTDTPQFELEKFK